MFNKIITFLVGLVFGMALSEYIEPTPLPEPRGFVEPAPIWSKLCTKRDMDFIARQADGKKWIIDCVKPGVKL